MVIQFAKFFVYASKFVWTLRASQSHCISSDVDSKEIGEGTIKNRVDGSQSPVISQDELEEGCGSCYEEDGDFELLESGFKTIAI